MTITSIFDYSQLTAAIEQASRYTKQTMAKVINTTAYFVSKDAKENTPFVPIARIDSELGISFKAGLTPTGKISKSKRNRVAVIPDESLAEKIIIARANPNSNYNRRTNNRWAIAPLRGTMAQKRAVITVYARKMIAQRHSGSKFLASGWIPATRILRGLAFDPDGAIDIEGYKPKGTASPAREGLTVEASIENDVGLSGVNAAGYNQALNLYGGPVLQDAINREGVSKMNYALEKMGNGVKANW